MYVGDCSCLHKLLHYLERSKEKRKLFEGDAQPPVVPFVGPDSIPSPLQWICTAIACVAPGTAYRVCSLANDSLQSRW